jgi:dynein heavy chain
VLYNKLGMENKKIVFLFTDQHVVEEGFLELINNMLTSGMVPALYPDDEKEGIIGSVSLTTVYILFLNSFPTK